MDKQDKIRIAITSGIGAVILLILVLVLALSGKKDEDSKKLEENIAAYSSTDEDSSTMEESPVLSSSEDASLGLTEEQTSFEASSQSSQSLIRADNADKNTKAVSGNSFYATTGAVLKNSKTKYDVQSQLYEMYEYWFQGNLEAVRDLAHLERFEAMSYSLSGSSDFYYYGEKDSDGKPNGMGLAVYAGSQYYYGSWSAGKRSGNGSWICFYPEYNTYVVTEHLYTGEWADDLPDGQGQEHFDYNPQYMNGADIYLQNAIGGFSQGKFNGEVYVITLENNGNTKEWDGTCDHGNWDMVPNASVDQKGNIPVLTSREDSDVHIYMTKSGSENNGVQGLISGGSMK